MPLSRYLKIYPCPDQPGCHLLYSTKKGSLLRVSADLLAAIVDDDLTGSERATLTRLELICVEPAVERREMNDLVRRSNARNSVFRGTVVLNLRCNLACTYCYEEGFRGDLEMTEKTADRLIEWVTAEHLDYGRDVEIQFYGGEPLLSLPLIHRIAPALQQRAVASGRKFSINMTTNGTLLTRKIVEQLLPYNFTKAIVTLDGPRTVHDQQRPFVSGEGSFDTIVANLKEVCDRIRIDLNGNYTMDNYREFPQLLDYLLGEGVMPERLGSVEFSTVTPKSGKGVDISAGCSSSTEKWLQEAGPYLRQEILRRGFQTSKPTMSACMVEFDHDLVINYDGTLYKCPAFMGWPELSVGTLESGIKDYSVSHNLAVWHNDECLDCAYLPLCFGGCRLNPLLRNGSINEVDCRREFYDAALEQFILQDLGHPPR
jgi:uncharacterized protein